MSKNGGRVVSLEGEKRGIVSSEGEKGGKIVKWQGSQNARTAYHQPAFMTSCLTISYTCLPCLSSGRTLFRSDLLVSGRVVSWKK